MNEVGFFSQSFLPHGHCFFWQPEILWLHVISDGLIALAYFSIPLALVLFVRRRRDLAFPWIFQLFGAFILLCGFTHVLGVVTVWQPSYGIEGLVKLATALVSLVTAAALWPLIPRALSLPSPSRLRSEIAERRRAEEALRSANAELEKHVEERTRQLQRSNAELEQFAYFASHDLRQPLRAIASFAELLEERHGRAFDQTGREYLDHLVHDARGLEELIESLLRHARTDREPLELERVGLDACLDQALADLEDRWTASGALVEREPLPVVEGNQRMLVSVFTNLLGNAIKYAGKAPPRVRVWSRPQADLCRVTVEDEGIGIEERHQERIFDAFERLHAPGVEGTGIGLSLCRRIVHLHGGDIHVESRPGRGTAFHFTLPPWQGEASAMADGPSLSEGA